MKPTGLYIDFPFCVARCAFCGFSVQGYRERPAEAYAAALEKELRLHAKEALNRHRLITSIYFGGGTPTIYPVDLLTGLLSLCRKRFHIASDAEISMEAHPATINAANLVPLRKAGVNRLSIGVQSFSDKHLRVLGRNHNAREAREAFHAARQAGFSNIGIDLMYALPEQTAEEWEETLQAAIALSPEHIALYALSIEEGTLFHKKQEAGDLSLPSEEETIAFYETARTRLKQADYAQYEISNFARPGYASRHNLRYWDRGEILAVGLAAHSYLNREHRENTDSLSAYLEQLASDHLPLVRKAAIDAREEEVDKIIFGLRKSEGIPLQFVTHDLVHKKTANRLIKNCLLHLEDDRLRLTDKGIHFADEVAVAFL
ncbi:MAG: radical SAM family heme chaperone HemW [Nitrospira sp.]|nr:radical SAM family heme chaperone HemW [Candidatus Manganitrophaceae bacterium]HIL33943.1 radical SAM family heme chaperone HemW [Candidatus Manganitrophaceae bacterium]